MANKNLNPNHALDIQYRLASVWQAKGNLEHAIEGYRKILYAQPDHVPATLKLGNLMQEHGRLSEALTIFRQALEHNPNESRFHKYFVNALVGQAGSSEAFKYYQLVRYDTRSIDIYPHNILCCVVIRNEILRLPYFLTYYRQKGIDKFLVVDNHSTDGSLEYLLEQPDVFVWQSDYSFNKANFGAGWFELLLRRYGIGHWVLIVDADELLYYPDCETKSITDLCRQLDRKNKRAFNAILLDMYSDKSIQATHYGSGQNFLEVCPYFDRQFYHTKYEQGGPFGNQTVYFGGARERVFGKAGEYYLSKVPLLKYYSDCILAGGQHWTNLPEADIAAERGALLHFKYFSSFVDYARQESNRKEHYGGAMQYQEYAQGLAQDEALNLFDPDHSVKLENSEQLVQLGILHTDNEDPVPQATAVDFPCIEPVAETPERPFWSVMITVYNRLDYFGQALKSVLEQAPGPDEMQIEVVNDGSDVSIQNQIEAIIKAIAGDRVHFYRHPINVGHPDIFNVCLRRARGRWIHLLHDDDWIAPEFYQTLRAGIETAPKIGAAFCRHAFVDTAGHRQRLSWLERETPGIIDNWLERIGVMCRLQTPAIVVKRQVYEQLGGYCSQAKSTFDWEMWQRIAVHYPVWFEPRPLAFFREHPASESSDLVKSGRQIVDTRRVIEIAQSYLPCNSKNRLSAKARENYALYALDVAKRQLQVADYQAAIANIREGLQCSQSPPITEKLVELLLQSENGS
ncbi:MAG: glycosyltransferase [Planctomycetota bacterium]|nr:MAG: glycosyltransferase [Planctomycetota bacterium]